MKAQNISRRSFLASSFAGIGVAAEAVCIAVAPSQTSPIQPQDKLDKQKGTK